MSDVGVGVGMSTASSQLQILHSRVERLFDLRE